MRIIHFIFIAGLAMGFGCVVSLADAGTVRTVALSRDAAPGIGVHYFGFGSLVLNDAGQAAFGGVVAGRGVIGDTQLGIWLEGEGSGLAQVVGEGEMAPGTGGIKFSSFGLVLLLNDVGQTAFRGILSGTGVDNSNNSGIWSEGGGGGLALVARTGNTAPDTSSGVNFAVLDDPVLNGMGQTAFRGSLTGTGVDSSNNSGIWSEGGSGGLALVARAGDSAPGTGGASFSNLGFVPVLNDVGQTAFRGFLAGIGVGSSNSSGIWSEGGGNGLALTARAGNAAPDTSSGVNFAGFDQPALNGAGQTAFNGRLTGPGVDVSNDRGIWSEGGGSGLALVAREGNAAPDTSNGVNFAVFDQPVINGMGQTAFRGSLTGTDVDSSNNSGIWSERGGSGLALVARAGDSAPGTSTGVKFQSFSKDLVLNNVGQIAFSGKLTGPGVNSSNSFGIWVEDLSGMLRLIARTGDQIDTDNGPGTVFRTIRVVTFVDDTGNGDGRPSGFNNRGQLAFRVAFTDKSNGIFVSNVATIPEPSALLGALSLVALLVALLGRPRSAIRG